MNIKIISHTQAMQQVHASCECEWETKKKSEEEGEAIFEF